MCCRIGLSWGILSAEPTESHSLSIADKCTIVQERINDSTKLSWGGVLLNTNPNAAWPPELKSLFTPAVLPRTIHLLTTSWIGTAHMRNGQAGALVCLATHHFWNYIFPRMNSGALRRGPASSLSGR
jgi:hypothetical protein